MMDTMELTQACIVVSLFMILASVILFLIFVLSWRIEIYPGDIFFHGTLLFWLATSFMTGVSGFMWFNIWLSIHVHPMAFLLTTPMNVYWGMIHGKWFAGLTR